MTLRYTAARSEIIAAMALRFATRTPTAKHPQMGSLSVSSSSASSGGKLTRFSSKAQVIAVVEADGEALRDADVDLRADKDVVRAAALQLASALAYASGSLRADRELVHEVVARDGRALEHASADLQADKGLVLTAVSQTGSALRHAARALKGDRDVVVAAVSVFVPVYSLSPISLYRFDKSLWRTGHATRARTAVLPPANDSLDRGSVLHWNSVLF